MACCAVDFTDSTACWAGPVRTPTHPARWCGCRSRPRQRCPASCHHGRSSRPSSDAEQRRCRSLSWRSPLCVTTADASRPRCVLSDDTAGRGGGHRENTSANPELVIGPSSRVDHWRSVQNRLVGRDARDRLCRRRGPGERAVPSSSRLRPDQPSEPKAVGCEGDPTAARIDGVPPRVDDLISGVGSRA